MYNSPTFTVIGISDSHTPLLTPEAKEAIKNASYYSGGKRHHEIMSAFLPENHKWIDITVPLANVFDQYRTFNAPIVVFASGDPLFFGFAATLQREFPDSQIKTHAWFNSLQTLAHRVGLPYQSMRNVSLTGRPWHDFYAALISGEPLIGVLTDKHHTPAAIASIMLEYGYSNYLMYIGENLGNESKERITTMELQEAANSSFDNLNCVILHQTEYRNRFFGIPDVEFHHLPGRERMITKMPIRLLDLSLMGIRNRHTLWDIGFCTGSVSIEAKMQNPALQVIAFEIRPESEELIKLNMRKFGVPGIVYNIGDFSQCDISAYPRPDAVFLGGHGGKLAEILTIIDSILLSGGVIVFNSVNSESLNDFRNAITRLGRKITEEHTIHLDSFNPITVIKAQ